MVNAIVFISILFFISNISFAAPNIEVWQTPEGAKVLFSQSKGSNIVDIKLAFDAASSREGDKYGLAAITNNMLGSASDKYNEEQINDGFNKVGAIFSVSSAKDMAVVSLRTLSRKEALRNSVALFSQIIANAKFTNKVFNRLKKKYLHTIKYEQTKPSVIAEKAFAANLFTNHIYAHASIGTKNSISKLTIKDVREHYHKYYVAKNLNIAIVGDISRAYAKQIARQISHNLSIGKKAQVISKVTPLAASKVLNIHYPSTQSHISIGKTGLNRDNPNYHALYLANHIFGGNALNSELGYIIREQNGLAYSVYSYFLPMAANGFFAIKLQTKNSQKDEAINLSLKTLRDFITQGITDEKIKDAKDNIVGSFALRVATNSQIVNYLTIIGFYNLDIDYLKHFPEKIAQLTKQQIIVAANDFFANDKWLIVSVGGKK